jgi:hypothetical protein
MNPFHTLQPDFQKIHFSIILPSTPRSSEWSLPFGFPNEIFLRIYHLPVRATCPANLILHDLAILIVFCEEYKFSLSILCNKIKNWSPFCSNCVFCTQTSERQLQSFVLTNTVLGYLSTWVRRLALCAGTEADKYCFRRSQYLSAPPRFVCRCRSWQILF